MSMGALTAPVALLYHALEARFEGEFDTQRPRQLTPPLVPRLYLHRILWYHDHHLCPSALDYQVFLQDTITTKSNGFVGQSYARTGKKKVIVYGTRF